MRRKCKTRYIFIAFGIAFLISWHYLLCYINKTLTDYLKHPNWKWKWRNELPHGLDASYISSVPRRKSETFNSRNCRMETCFDFTKCKGSDRQFKVYVYPEDILGGQRRPSDSYEKV